MPDQMANRFRFIPACFSLFCVLANWHASKALEKGGELSNVSFDGPLLIIFVSFLIIIKKMLAIYRFHSQLGFAGLLKNCKWRWFSRLWPCLLLAPMLVRWKLSTTEFLPDGTKSIVAVGYGSDFSFIALLSALLAIIAWEAVESLKSRSDEA